MKNFLIILSLLPLFVSPAFCGGQDDLEKGIDLYEHRYTWSPNFSFHPENVDLSIQYLEKALNDRNTREVAGQHLLWAYFFKAMFTCIDEDCKKDAFSRGKAMGEMLTEEYPKNLNIKFGYTTNLGKWSELNGLFASACQGVAGKIKNTLDDAMAMDKNYLDGLGYRLKSILYYKAPYIPVLVPWASKEEAFEMSRFAVDKWPESIGNRLTLGELLYWSGQYEEARSVFVDMQSMKPRKDHYILDQFEIDKASKYLKKIDAKNSQSRID